MVEYLAAGSRKDKTFCVCTQSDFIEWNTIQWGCCCIYHQWRTKDLKLHIECLLLLLLPGLSHRGRRWPSADQQAASTLCDIHQKKHMRNNVEVPSPSSELRPPPSRANQRNPRWEGGTVEFTKLLHSANPKGHTEVRGHAVREGQAARPSLGVRGQIDQGR